MEGRREALSPWRCVDRGGGGSRGPGGRGGTAVRRCEEIHVPMCKGLVGYTRTKLPNRFNHTTQLQVYR